jgi:predicted negative regulator of RcsB-dependent stress response
MVLINSGGAPGTGAGCNPDKPKKPTAATTAKKGAAAAKPKNPPKPPNAGLKNLVAQMAALSAAQVAQNAVNEAIARAVINKAAAELVDDPLNSIAAAARAAVKVPGKIKKASDEAKVEAAKEVAVQTAKMVLAAVDGVPFI